MYLKPSSDIDLFRRFRLLDRLNFNTLWKVAIGVTIAGFLGSGIFYTKEHFNRNTYKVEVTGTAAIPKISTNKDDEGKVTDIETIIEYRVFASDLETGEPRVFENTNSILECFFDGCKYNSSEFQARLEDAKNKKEPLEIKVYGYRRQRNETYENIVPIESLRFK